MSGIKVSGDRSGCQRLSTDQLYVKADLSKFSFETAAEPDHSDDIICQPRALSALQLGARVKAAGFNVFVVGPSPTWMRRTVKTYLQAEVALQPTPSDWVYVNNFVLPHRPLAIELPSGRANVFRDRMHELVQDLKIALPAAFESAEYQSHRDIIDETTHQAQEKAFAQLRDRVAERDIAILRSPVGFGLAPMRDGKVIPPDQFKALSDAEQDRIQKTIQELEPELEQAVRALPQLEKQRRDAFRKLDRETAQGAVSQSIDEAKRDFSDLPQILRHLDSIREDLIENVALFIMPQIEGAAEAARLRLGGPFDRYEVNVLVSEAERGAGRPVIEELHPTLGNLTGRVEHLAQEGMLITNFRLIKAGVLHRANGGFLLLDLRSLLSETFSWPTLKRALLQRQIVIEDLTHSLGFSSTVTLEPDPIPLDVKVVLFCDRQLYNFLLAFDPEVDQHFKVLADFEDDITRTASSEEDLSRSITSMARREGIRPIGRGGLERILEYSSRLAGDQQKLTLVMDQIRDLAVEADFWAGNAKHDEIARADVEHAIAQRIERSNRVDQRRKEAIHRGISLIDTCGSREGQVNGLSVFNLTGHSFGTPTRISCRVRPGSGKIIDIEREVELGGPIHSKGVLILSGFLAGRYALETPMSLYASIVFEQSYGGVEGDSASAAELCALLSALAQVPLRQDCALTGSVNQLGDIQAIGGVNEKIEGFFDICRERGLTGTQCVIIPASNAQHLMLRSDIIAACAEERFSVYTASSIDEAIELLTGLTAGLRDESGQYPNGSLNRRVEDRLIAFSQKIDALHRDSARAGPET